MTEFIIGAVVVLILWFLYSMRSHGKAQHAFNAADEAEQWFVKEGIKPSSVLFSVYDEPSLAKNRGATVLVGGGDTLDGKHVGFVLEVLQGSGVVQALYLEPDGIATHHQRGATLAKSSGVSLMDAMNEMARRHRASRIG
jgi:hypothetical protein